MSEKASPASNKRRIWRANEGLVVSEIIRRGGACQDCGAPYEQGKWGDGKFHWHHRDAESKDFNIAAFGTRTAERILSELAKCDLLCSSCHRKRHHASS
jgi:hypothetical protein